MAGSGDRGDEAALWRRWRALSHGASEPDTAWLAAYAEGRLDAVRGEAVEAWLAEHPEALDDLIAARDAAGAVAAIPSEAVIARALGLVATPGDKIVPFPRALPQRRNWRAAVAWSGLAASILIAGFFGFALTTSAQFDAIGQPAADSALRDLLDPPSGLFSGFDEDQAT
jgi:anti-sigma factor RsiW